jgi:hypothetical protein
LIDPNTRAPHKARENPILRCNMNPTRVLQHHGVILMTSASMTFGRPARLTIPRGSLWFGNLAAFLIERLRRLDRWQLGMKQDERRDADDVLAWATRIEHSDPGFAADLRAAALRSMDGLGR